MEEVPDYKNLTVDELKEEYANTLADYEKWVDKEFEFDMDWENELLHIIGSRDDLHEILAELKKRGEILSTSKLEAIDAKWKSGIKKSRDPDYRFGFKRNDEPKEKWWWWTDQEISIEEDR
jgi:hypothetical protein